MSGAYGYATAYPFRKNILGLAGYIKDSLVYWLGLTIDEAEYPNKIGSQDRAAAGGEVFTGRALAFDGVDQYASVADNGALDVAATEALPTGNDMNVSDCENDNYITFANTSPTGFSVISDGATTHNAGTADEISITTGKDLRITFDLVLNSGTVPKFRLTSSLGGAIASDAVLSIVGTNEVIITPTSTTVGVLQFYNQSQVADFSITNLSVKEVTYDFVISGLVKAGIGSASEAFFGKTDVAGGAGRYVWFKANDNKIGFVLQTETVTIVEYTSIDTDLDTDEHLFTARIDISGSRLYIYTDGVLENIGGTAFTGTIPAYNGDFAVAAANDGVGWSQYADTQIRDVRIYHKDVTSAANLAALQAGERLGDEVAWWFCEGTDLLEVFDASGNDYHLTAANFDSTSFVEGNWQSLYNKFGYAIDVGGEEFHIDANAASDPNDNEADTITGWNQSGLIGTGNNIFESQSLIKNAGSYSLHSDANDTPISGAGFSKTFAGLTLNRKYKLSHDWRHVGLGGSNGLYVNDGSGTISIDELIASDVVFAYYEYIFHVTLGASATVYYREADGGNSGGLYVDNISFKPYYDTAIPPDMSTGAIPTHDIFGNELTFAGQAQYPAIARDRSCFVGDGVAAAYNTDWRGVSNVVSGVASYIDFEVVTLIKTGNVNSRLFGDGALADGREGFFILIDTSGNIDGQLSDGTNRQVLTEAFGSFPHDEFIKVNLRYDVTGILSFYINDTLVSSVSTTFNTNNLSSYYNQIGVGVGLSLASGDKIQSFKITVDGIDIIRNEFVEGQGSTVYDVSGNGNHLTGVNVDNNNWGVIDLPDEDYLAEKGGNFVGQFNGVDDYINLASTITIDKDADTNLIFKFKLNSNGTITSLAGWSVSGGINYIYITGTGVIAGETNLNSEIFNTLSPVITDTDFHKVEVRINNSIVTILVDDINVTMNNDTITNDILLNRIGTRGVGDLWNGDIYSVEIINNTTGDYIFNMSLNGFDSTEEDVVSSNNGTWVGTGQHTAIIPALADKSADALDQPIVYSQSGNQLVPHTYMSMPEVKELIDADLEERYEGGLMDTGKGTFDDGTTESWTVAGGNLMENEDDALKFTYVDDANGGYILLRAADDLVTDLIISDSYKVIISAKVNSGSSAQLFLSHEGGSGGGVFTVSNTEYQEIEIDFVAGSVTGCYIRAQGLSAGEIIWIDTWEIFHKTEQYGNKMNVSDCENDSMTSFANETPVGFDATNDGLQTGRCGTADEITLISGATYNVTCDAIFNSGSIVNVVFVQSLGVGVISNSSSFNAGSNSIDLIPTETTTGVLQIYQSGVVDFEITNLSIRPIIDGEFFEPIALGSDPVIVSNNYLLSEPFRYLVRYVNVAKRKDLMLLAAGHELTYDDHLVLSDYLDYFKLKEIIAT